MNKRLTYFLSLFLSINVLLAGIGLPVYVQTCLMSGARQVSILLPPQSNCMADMPSAKACIKKDSCCTYEVNYLKSVPVTARVMQLVSMPWLHFVAVAFGRADLLPLISMPGISRPQANGPPLAVSGRDILSNIQVFRI